jgi:hypothetical protein
MVAIIFIFAFLALVGIAILIGNIPNMKRRQRIMATPTSPIAAAPGNGPVEVKGRIVPSEQGVIESPFSGRHAVWVRITVQELRRSGRSTYWHTLFCEDDSRLFFVDDSSGQTARVIAQGANMMLDKNHVADSGTFKDPPPHLAAFLASRGHATTSWFGFNKSMRYQEEILAPGESVYALGPSRRDAGPPVGDGYRVAPSSQLVLFHAGKDDGELILTNKAEAELVSKLYRGFVGGCVLAGIGAAACVVTAVAMVVR